MIEGALMAWCSGTSFLRDGIGGLRGALSQFQQDSGEAGTYIRGDNHHGKKDADECIHSPNNQGRISRRSIVDGY